MRTLVVDVTGTPAPQGSKIGIPIRRANGKTGVALMEAAGDRVKTWRQDVRAAADDAMRTAKWTTPPQGTSLVLLVAFYLARPKSHYRTGKHSDELRPDAPAYPTGKPDLDKLVRAVGDALTSAAAYRDDSNIVVINARKLYADGRNPGAIITIAATP